jgi:hypothetical protein
LVGFEIESSNLPSTPAAADAIGRVRNFLTNSAEGEIGTRQPTWQRVSDHSKGLMDAINQQRKVWATELTGQNQAELRTGNPYTAMVEYVTDPFDERSANDYEAGGLLGYLRNQVLGTNTMDATIGEIDQEIDDAKQNLMVLGGAQVGVPPVADWEEAATYYRLQFPDDENYSETNAKGVGRLTRKAVMDQVDKDEHNVQATVGILPEKINAFLAGAANQASVTGTSISAQDPRVAGVAQLKFLADTMGEVDQAVDALVQDLTGAANELPTQIFDQQAALGGFLRLLLHVTTADIARYGPGDVGGNDKNMQSFLPKTPLHIIEQLLPKEVRPSNQRTWLFPWTFNAIVQKVYDTHLAVAAKMQRFPGGDVLTQAQVDGTDPASRLGAGSVRAYLRTVLAGSSDPNTAHQAAGRLDPEKPSKGGREGVATGNWFSNKRTRAVAIETRHAVQKLPRAGLLTFAREIAALVRDSHQ